VTAWNLYEKDRRKHLLLILFEKAFNDNLNAFRLKVAIDNKMLIPPVDSLNDFISKVFIAIAIGGLVFGLSLFLATLIYPHFLK
jgi:hypothetical protein